MASWIPSEPSVTTRVFTLKEISQAVQNKQAIIEAVESGFVQSSSSQDAARIAPIVHIPSSTVPFIGKGECDIKSGFLRNRAHFVVKIGSGGFKGNPALGLSPNGGVMLVYSQQTGILEGILLDEGLLTELRTAAAGALAAKYFAPKTISSIGVIGTGIQARFQLDMLRCVTSCRNVVVWGRNDDHVRKLKSDIEPLGYSVSAAQSTHELASKCNLIISCTSSKSPLLDVSSVRPGTHITAMGSDTKGKQELDANILKKSDLVIVDNLQQCAQFGELQHAGESDCRVVELGKAISEEIYHRKEDDNRITVTDLTGVAIQDVQIATNVFETLTKTSKL